MENHGDPILDTKKRKIKSDKEATLEQERTYGIESLNIADTAHAENDSVLGEKNANGHESE